MQTCMTTLTPYRLSNDQDLKLGSADFSLRIAANSSSRVTPFSSLASQIAAHSALSWSRLFLTNVLNT